MGLIAKGGNHGCTCSYTNRLPAEVHCTVIREYLLLGDDASWLLAYFFKKL